MAARFEPGEALRKAFARAAAEEVAAVRQALSGEDDPETAVHRARRAIKRLRALLRLARPALGGGFKKASSRWRDAGRLLAGGRDAAVVPGTYDKVAEASGGLPAKQVSAIRQKLNGGAVQGSLDRENGAVAEAVERAGKSMDKLRWPRTGGDLFEGFLRTQRRLQERRKSARADPHSENLHEWRKRLKDDAAQAGLLRAVLPEALALRREEGKQVAEILGEEHDLAMLQGRLGELTAPRGTKQTRDRLVRAIAEKRAELSRVALARGEALARPKPKAFAREIVACWASAREEAGGRAAKGRRKR